LNFSDHPAVGARTDDPVIRRMPVTRYPYLVFYEVRDDEIIVHAIRHGARNPDRLVRSD
jgi:plasmid stabilization system protein ParE